MKRCTSRMFTDFVERLAAAAIVAGMLADAARGCGQRIVEDHGLESVFQPALLIKLEEARNVHAQRATVLAGREGQLLADAGAAAMRDDVVFVLLAEVAHGGEHGIGRRLAEPAERTLADHAAQLVEQVQVLARFRCPWVMAFRMRSALFEPHAAGHALAAGLGVGELDEVAGHIDHAVVFVHHHHAAGAHDGADLRQAFVVDRRIEHLHGNAAARRPAGLHGLDAAAVARRLRRCRR